MDKENTTRNERLALMVLELLNALKNCVETYQEAYDLEYGELERAMFRAKAAIVKAELSMKDDS